jgi:hypothetical protein
LNFNEIGQVLSFALAIFGATIGCYITGTTAYKLWNKKDVDRSRLIIAAMSPLSVIIYGFSLMCLLSFRVADGILSIESAVTIATTTGMVFLFMAIVISKACMPALQATVKGAEAFARAFIPVVLLCMIPFLTFIGAILLI